MTVISIATSSVLTRMLQRCCVGLCFRAPDRTVNFQRWWSVWPEAQGALLQSFECLEIGWVDHRFWALWLRAALVRQKWVKQTALGLTYRLFPSDVMFWFLVIDPEALKSKNLNTLFFLLLLSGSSNCVITGCHAALYSFTIQCTSTVLTVDFDCDFGRERMCWCWNGDMRGEESEQSWKRQQLTTEKETGWERGGGWVGGLSFDYGSSDWQRGEAMYGSITLRGNRERERWWMWEVFWEEFPPDLCPKRILKSFIDFVLSCCLITHHRCAQQWLCALFVIGSLFSLKNYGLYEGAYWSGALKSKDLNYL